AVGRLEAAAVPGVACVHESRDAPVLADPVRVLDPPEQQVAAADHGVGAPHAEALERVAAHRLVAAGAKEEGRWDSLARLGDHHARLGAKEKVVAAERDQPQEACGGAQERLRRDAGGSAAEGELDDGAAPRQLPGIGVAKLRAIAEEERMAMVDELADELLLVVHRDLEGRGLAAESPVEREPAGELARLLVLHALLAPLQEVVAPAPARARRRVEVEPALPVQVVEADLAPQPPRALEDVEVG